MKPLLLFLQLVGFLKEGFDYKNEMKIAQVIVEQGDVEQVKLGNR